MIDTLTKAAPGRGALEKRRTSDLLVDCCFSNRAADEITSDFLPDKVHAMNIFSVCTQMCV